MLIGVTTSDRQQLSMPGNDDVSFGDGFLVDIVFDAAGGWRYRQRFYTETDDHW